MRNKQMRGTVYNRSQAGDYIGRWLFVAWLNVQVFNCRVIICRVINYPSD